MRESTEKGDCEREGGGEKRLVKKDTREPEAAGLADMGMEGLPIKISQKNV